MRPAPPDAFLRAPIPATLSAAPGRMGVVAHWGWGLQLNSFLSCRASWTWGGGTVRAGSVPQDRHVLRAGPQGWCSSTPEGDPHCSRKLNASAPPWLVQAAHPPFGPYLLPLSGGSWLPTFDWALLSWLNTSLSSAPWKCSRKEPGLRSSCCKCLAAQARSEMMRRDNLEGHRQVASAERQKAKSLSLGARAEAEMRRDAGPGAGSPLAPPLRRAF